MRAWCEGVVHVWCEGVEMCTVHVTDLFQGVSLTLQLNLQSSFFLCHFTQTLL